MISAQSAPKSGEGFWLWFIKILSGLLVIAILITHLIVNHFVAQNGLLSWQDVVNYYQNPIIPLMEIAFVTIVVSHALIGLRSIILDLKPSRSVLTFVNWLFSIVGVVSVVYGIWLITVIVSFGK